MPTYPSPYFAIRAAVTQRAQSLMRRIILLLALGSLFTGEAGGAVSVPSPPPARLLPVATPKITGAEWENESYGLGVKLSLATGSGRAVVEFRYPAGGIDLSAFRDFAVRLENQTAAKLDILVTGLSGGKDTYRNTSQTRFLVNPSEKIDLKVFMARAPLPKDHPFVQRLGNLYAFPWGYQRHWQHVDAFALVRVTVRLDWFGAKPGDQVRISQPFGHELFSVDPALLGTLPFPIVDEFGQDSSRSWSGKVSQAMDLLEDTSRDLALVASITGPSGDRSRFGGDARAPRRKATGFFRVEKISGKWWFIDPEGHLFWSLGVNGAAVSSSTRVKGRETLFPESDRSKVELNHYVQNVKRKHGEAVWRKNHCDVTLARMFAWGLNTVGAWSEPELLSARRVPYTLIAHPDLHGVGGIRKMVDPFAEGFRSSLDKTLAKLAVQHANSPWLLGVFIENELDWKGGITLAEEVLASPSQTPARRALVSLLQERYPDISALNQAWGTHYESFDTVRPMAGPGAPAAYGQDIREYLIRFADTFFAACAAAMDKHFPNHLYLGCRLHAWNPLITASASRYCDVISVNAYRYDMAGFSLTVSEEKPWLISEYHFGTRDFGAWGVGLTWAANARNQSDLVRAYLSDALRHPNIIGAHWFQWSGQAVTGRNDGENFGVGLVTIVDRPVDPLVNTFRRVSKALYDYRLSSSTTGSLAPIDTATPSAKSIRPVKVRHNAARNRQ